VAALTLSKNFLIRNNKPAEIGKNGEKGPKKRSK
jgi:hypothetical protein